MTDLVEFLRARLDEDEKEATAATPGPWHIPEHDPLFYCVDSPDGSGRICKFGDRRCSDDVHNSLHIARHDPARVLREVEAKRAILALHTEAQSWSYPPGDGDEAVQETLETVARHHAAVYSDHPDYDPAWSVASIA